MITLLDSSNLVARTLEPRLHSRLPAVGLEVFASYEPLRRRLSRMRGEGAIVILAVENRCQLLRFRELQDLVGDLRLLLILPDHEGETLRLGHRLYPRFIAYRDGDFDDVAAVVARMHARLSPAQKGDN
ncbi:MAG: hypothetical protein AB1568_14865 [Thermodesulfobacteriota bacterium]